MRRLIEKFMAPAAFLGLALAVTVLGFTLASGYSTIGLLRSLVDSTIAADAPVGQEHLPPSPGQTTGETPGSSPQPPGEDVGTDSERADSTLSGAGGPSSPAAQ